MPETVTPHPPPKEPSQPQQTMAFDCSACGQCCSVWQVPIDTQRAKFLLQQPWAQHHLTQFNTKLLPYKEQANHPYRLPLKPDKTCVFLENKSGHCLIQKHHGANAKPLDCQRFPFAATRPSPQAPLVYNVTAACNSIASRLMLPLLPITPSATEAATFEPHSLPFSFTQQHTKTSYIARYISRYPWPFGSLNPLPLSHLTPQWEAPLRPIFLNPSLNVWQALRYAKHYALFQHLPANPPKPHPPRWAWFITCLFLRKPYGLFAWVNLLWPNPRSHYHDAYLFGNQEPLPVLPLQQAFTLLNSEGKPRAHALRHRSAKHKAGHRAATWLQALVCSQRQRAELFRQGSASPSVSSQQQQATLKGLAWLILTRRVALVNGQSLLGQISVAVTAILLVYWYANALTYLQYGATASIQHSTLVLAIRLVERYYSAHQAKWLALFTHTFTASSLALWAL